MRAFFNTLSDFHIEKLRPLTTFKVSEKTYGQIPRKLPEGRIEGWKDGHDQGVQSVDLR